MMGHYAGTVLCKQMLPFDLSAGAAPDGEPILVAIAVLPSLHPAISQRCWDAKEQRRGHKAGSRGGQARSSCASPGELEY